VSAPGKAWLADVQDADVRAVLHVITGLRNRYAGAERLPVERVLNRVFGDAAADLAAERDRRELLAAEFKRIPFPGAMINPW
jgi:hypothetical protein